VITSGDVFSISDHYLLAHTLIPEIAGLKADYTFEIVPVTTSVDSGDLAIFEIVIGAENSPVLDMHGLSFSLNLPESLVDLSTVSVDFYSDSWLGHDAATIDMQQQPGNNGRLDAAFTRTTGTPASGIGAVAKLSFIVEDDIEGFKTPDGRVPLRVGVNGVNSMKSNGMMYDVSATGAVIYFDPNTVQQQSIEDVVFVYPNPSDGASLNVHVNGERTLQQIDILDLSGSMVYSRDQLSTKHFSPDVSTLKNGLYFMRVATTDGVVTKKFEVFRGE
jgi:hypothetical protein